MTFGQLFGPVSVFVCLPVSPSTRVKSAPFCRPSSYRMLLAQINRDSQGMSEFHDADGQPVTLCLTEAVAVAGEFPDEKNLATEKNREGDNVCVCVWGSIVRSVPYF